MRSQAHSEKLKGRKKHCMNDATKYKGPEPRCPGCELLLPCTCEGKGLHAVDFMRSGERPALAFSRMFRDS